MMNYARNLSIALRLRDTCARAVRNALGNVYLISLTKNLWYEQHEQLDSGVEVRCHKVQGMTEAVFDSIIPGKLICCLAREKSGKYGFLVN